MAADMSVCLHIDVNFLESLFVTQFAVCKDFWADFWEFLAAEMAAYICVAARAY